MSQMDRFHSFDGDDNFDENERLTSSDDNGDDAERLNSFNDNVDESERLTTSDGDRSSVDGERGPLLTVDEAVELIGFGRFQLKLLVVSGACWVADAAEMMLLLYLSVAVQCTWQLDQGATAAITTVVFLGMLLGAWAIGNLSDRWGRRPAFLASASIVFVAGIVSAFSPNVWFLYVSRFFVGFGVGGGHVAFTLFSEFCPTGKRAKYLLSINLFWAAGTVLTAAVAWAIMPSLPQDQGWRALLAVASVPSLVLCVFYFVFLPESPSFLQSTGRTQRAKAILVRASRVNGSRSKLPAQFTLVNSRVAAAAAPANRDVVSGQAPLTTTMTARHGQLRDLFHPLMRRETLLLWILWLTATFTYYGYILLVGKLFLLESDGTRCPETTGFAAASPTPVPTVGTGPAGPVAVPAPGSSGPVTSTTCSFTERDFTDAMITTCGELPGILLAMFVIDRLGRRWTMVSGFTILGLATVPLVFCMPRSMETVIIFCARSAAAGVFQALYVYSSEVHPLPIRSTGLGMCSGIARFGGMLTPYVVVLLTVADWLPEAIYAALAFVAAGCSYLLPYETSKHLMPNSFEDLLLLKHKDPVTSLNDVPLGNLDNIEDEVLNSDDDQKET